MFELNLAGFNLFEPVRVESIRESGGLVSILKPAEVRKAVYGFQSKLFIIQENTITGRQEDEGKKELAAAMTDRFCRIEALDVGDYLAPVCLSRLRDQ